MRTYEGPYLDSKDKARTLLSQPEGITINRAGGEPVAPARGRYAVATTQAPLRLDASSAPDALVSRVARFIDALPCNVACVGAFFEGETLTVEAVDVVDGYLDAVLLGFERGRDTVRNIETGEEVILREKAGVAP